MGRPREFDEASTLDRIEQSFHRHGYEATSLADLRDASGLSSSSLYQAFGSKRSLFLRCLDRYQERNAAVLRDALDGAADVPATIAELFDAVIAADTSGERIGCLMVNAGTEMPPGDAEVGDRARAAIEQSSVLFADAIRRSQRLGQTPADRDPVALGRALAVALGGLRVAGKAGVPADVLRDSLTPLLALLR